MLGEMDILYIYKPIHVRVEKVIETACRERHSGKYDVDKMIYFCRTFLANKYMLTTLINI